MLHDLEDAMKRAFEMTDLGLMEYFFGIDVMKFT